MSEPSEALFVPEAGKWLESVADPVRLAILRSLSQVEDATASDLAIRSQASSQTLRRHLEALVSVGVVREHPAQSDGETPGRPAARFSLSSAVRESVRSVFDAPTLRPAARLPLAQVDASGPSATFASTRPIAAAGPMNGAKAK